MKARRQHSEAFTLLELVLVLMVITIMTALVAPRLSGFIRGRQASDEAQNIAALTRYTRTQAISESAVYRLNLDTSAGKYWASLETGPDGAKTEAPLPTEEGRVHQVPQGITLQFISADPNNTSASQQPIVIHFYPDGRTEPGTITLRDAQGQGMNVDCPSATDLYRVTEPSK